MRVPAALARVLLVTLSLSASTASLRADVVLSNLNNTPAGFTTATPAFWRGNLFATGDSASSYTLDGITLRMNDANNASGSFFVRVYTDADGAPGSPVGADLAGTDNPATAGNYTYTASEIALSPSTAYWLVVGVSGGTGDYVVRATTSDAFTATGNWALFPDDSFITSTTQASTWSVPISISQLLFSVSATPAVPEPGHFAALLAAGALGLAEWRRRTRKTSST